ncbi:TPA: hypothetical protein ACS735_003119 [Providencia alcalifaciens]
MHVKVIVAYCIELGKIISIGEAQMYFAAQKGIKKDSILFVVILTAA